MKPLDFSFDVIITGAGPAGCTAALAMGNSGLKVLLIDKQKNSNSKICGGALAAYIPKVLHSIRPDFADAFHQWNQKNPVNTCLISFDRKQSVEFIFSQTGWICRREEFDSFMLELVKTLPNVTICKNQKVIDVFQYKDRIDIKTYRNDIFQSKLLIACDGANSIIRKKLLHRTIDKTQHATAVRAIYSNVSGLKTNTFEMHFLKELSPGYFWIFPLNENECNVGLGMSTQKIIRNKVQMKALLLKTISEYPQFISRFENALPTGKIEGAGLPLGTTKLPVSGSRFMLCGDAASLIDPLTGEGIGQAMISGRYAGWHAIDCFRKDSFHKEFMSQYDTTLYNKLWKNNRRRKRIVNLILNFPSIFKAGLLLTGKSRFFHKMIRKKLESS